MNGFKSEYFSACKAFLPAANICFQWNTSKKSTIYWGKTPELKDKYERAWLLRLPKCVSLAAMMLQYYYDKMTAVVDWCSIDTCERGLARTHWVSEFLPCVMTPVNSTSLRASTWNQLLVSSGSAHHAPPYRSSSFSEPCSWPQLVLEPVCHPALRTNFGHNPAIIPIFQTSAGRGGRLCLPACWVAPVEPKSHDGTERKPAAAPPPPDGIPGQAEDSLGRTKCPLWH